MLGKSERRRIHGLILATLLHSGGPLLMVFLAERPTPTTRQVSSGGPPPQVLRDPGQPLTVDPHLFVPTQFVFDVRYQHRFVISLGHMPMARYRYDVVGKVL